MIDESKTKIYRFLKWTEKWTKTDMVYLAKGSYWLTINQILSILIAFFSSIVFANYLPVATLGKYKYVLSIATILTTTTLIGMRTAITQAVARGNDGILLSAVKTRIKYGFFGSFISIGLSVYYYFNHDNSTSIAFLIVSFFVPFVMSFNSYADFLTGKKRFDILTKYSIISETIITSIIICTVYFFNNFLLIILSYYVSRFLIYLILFLRTKNKFKLKSTVDKKSINFGKHLSIINLVSIIAEQLDKILIFHYVGAAELALYAYATIPVDLIKSFLANKIAPLAIPKLANNNIETIKKTLPEKIIKFFIITIFIALSYVLAAPFIYNTFFPLYTTSIKFSKLLAITIPAIPLGLLSLALTAQLQKKKMYISSISSSILKIILYFIFIPKYGIMGVVISLLSYEIYHKTLLITLFKKMK